MKVLFILKDENGEEVNNGSIERELGQAEITALFNADSIKYASNNVVTGSSSSKSPTFVKVLETQLDVYDAVPTLKVIVKEVEASGSNFSFA